MSSTETGSVGTKTCPSCAKEIKERAAVCRYCGAEFDVAEQGYCSSCHAVGAAKDGRCAVCGGELVDVSVASTLRASAPVPVEPVRRPRRNRWTIAAWVVGIVLIVVGGAGFVIANHDDTYYDTTYAKQLRELRGNLQGSSAKATRLHNRTAAVAAALAAYVRSVDNVLSVDNAMIGGFNRASTQWNTTRSTTVAQTSLPPLIQRFQKAVAAEKAKRAALAGAVARLRKVTP